MALLPPRTDAADAKNRDSAWFGSNDPAIEQDHDPACRKACRIVAWLPLGGLAAQALDRRGSVISTMPGDMRLAWAIEGPWTPPASLPLARCPSRGRGIWLGGTWGAPAGAKSRSAVRIATVHGANRSTVW